MSSESENVVCFFVVNSGKLANKSLILDGKVVGIVVGLGVVVVVVVVVVDVVALAGLRVVSEGFKRNRWIRDIERY